MGGEKKPRPCGPTRTGPGRPASPAGFSCPLEAVYGHQRHRTVCGDQGRADAGEQRDDNQQDHDEVMIPNTFTQRGVPLVEEPVGPMPVSPPLLRRGVSQPCVSSFRNFLSSSSGENEGSTGLVSRGTITLKR